MDYHEHQLVVWSVKNLRDVGLGDSEVPIEKTPEEPGCHGPGKVLTEPKEQLHDERKEETQQHDGFASKHVRRPAPAETANKVSKEECTSKISSLLACTITGTVYYIRTPL